MAESRRHLPSLCIRVCEPSSPRYDTLVKYPVLAACLALAATGCSSNDGEAPPADETPKTPPEDVLGAEGAELEWKAIYTPDRANVWSATAIDFNPERPGELWVALRQFPSGRPCTEADRRGCAALQGQVAILEDAAAARPAFEVKMDENAWHFMRRPTALAFGEGDTFATCGEARTDNFEDDTFDYAGPVLWSSDPDVFAIQPPGKNGSHLDMLHDSPFCMGIAHEKGNVYWVFNGRDGALDRYDFKSPHEVGGEDHSDGELLRYALGQVKRTPEIPSHLVFDPETGFLYVADTGNGRVARLDTASGRLGRTIASNDPITVRSRMDDAEMEDFVPPGELDAPTGITLHRGVLFVTDNSTSEIHAYDQEGTELRVVGTGLPPGSLSGIAVSDDGRVFVSDLATGRVLRLELP